MRPAVGGLGTVEEMEKSRGEAIAGHAREGARKTLAHRLDDRGFARSVRSKKEDAESAVRSPEATHPASEVAQAIPDHAPWTPKRRPRAQLCPELVQAEPHRFPLAGFGSRDNQRRASVLPETIHLLSTAGGVLLVQAGEPMSMLFLQTPLGD